MGFCSATAKIVLCTISLIFWAVAALFSFLAYELFHTFKQYGDIDDKSATTSLAVAASIITAIAVLMFVIGLLGCCGSCSENKCCLISFFVFVLLVLILEVTIVVLGAVYQDELKEGLNTSIHKMVKDLDKFQETMDDIQKNLKCCGAEGPEDYIKEGMNHPPDSCCSADILDICTFTNSYKEGCVDKLWDVLKKNLVYVIVAGSVVGVFLLLSLIFSCYLAWRRRDDLPYATLNSEKRTTTYA